MNDCLLELTFKPGWAGRLLQKCPSGANVAAGMLRDTGGALQVYGANSEAAKIHFTTYTGTTIANNIFVGQPRLQVVWSSRPQQPQTQFAVGFNRFTTYRKTVNVNHGEQGEVSWSNIACDIVPYCFVICFKSVESFSDVNYFCPTDFSSVSVTTSVSSQPCGNYTGERVSLADQYRIYKRMTQNTDISYRTWYRFRRCLCFSATELGGSSPGMFRNVYQPLNLSVSLKFDRSADVLAPWQRTDDTAGVQTYQCYLMLATDASCVLSEAGVRVSEVKISAKEVLDAFTTGKGQEQPSLSSRGVQD